MKNNSDHEIVRQNLLDIRQSGHDPTHNELQRAIERNRIKPNLETGKDKETSISNQMIQTSFKNFLKSALLAQLLSILICGTAVVSSELFDEYKVNIPTFQSVLNYFLLGLVFLPFWLFKIGNFQQIKEIIQQKWWKYLLITLADVEANYFIIKAYSMTRITTIQVIDAFILPMTVLLSFLFLKQRYRINHVAAVVSALIGCALIIVGDVLVKSQDGENKLLGDIFCLLSSVLYAVSNVGSEYLIKENSKREYLTMIGIFGTLISCLQMFVFEKTQIESVFTFSNVNVWLLFLAQSGLMFSLYALIPCVLELSNAAFLNVNLLTADFYSVLVGIFIKKYTLHWLYFVGFAFILVGTMVFSISNTKKKISNAQTKVELDKTGEPNCEQA